MSYVELAPAELLSLGLASPAVTDRAWCVRWDEAGADRAELVTRTWPSTTDFETSGTTGPSRCWRRSRESLWREAGMLADLLRPQRPEAVVSFAPPRHLYGALASVLVPAQLAVPVWYRSTFYGGMPATERRRVVVAATPWIFRLLLEQIAWVRAMEQVTVLHSSAMLPATAGELLLAAGPGRVLIVEVLGSTEAGGVATRSWSEGEPPPWTLFPDVSFADAGTDGTTSHEVQLVVSSPRLAFPPDGQPPPVCVTDDYIERLDDRTFRFAGRRSRLVKVNGRRINLDEAEHAVRGVLDCQDLAIMPIADRMIGEHVDLLVVLAPGTELADLDLASAFVRLGVRPRRVQVVPRIDRSATGKVRYVQTGSSIGTEAA